MSYTGPFREAGLIASLRGLYDDALPHVCDIREPYTAEAPTPTRVRDAGGGWLPATASDPEADEPAVRSDVPCLFILRTPGSRAFVGDAAREDYDAIIELASSEAVTAKNLFVVDSVEYAVVSTDPARPNALRQRIRLKARAK